MKRLIFIIMCCFPFLSHSYAQDSPKYTPTERINKIKMKPEQYLYGEATMEKWEEASNSARLLLKEQVNVWLAQNNYDSIYISKAVVRAGESLSEIKAKRGKMFRAFAYLSKNKVTNIEKKDGDTTSIDSSRSSSMAKAITKSLQSSSIESMMLDVKSASDIEAFVKKLHKQGKITEYGRNANKPQDGTYYMFVFNREGKVLAHLKHLGKLLFFNLDEKKEVTLETFKGCGGIWFR